MIHSEVGLKQTIDLLAGQYHALASLHRDIAPQNHANFLVLAEGPIEQIQRLQQEINEYLGINVSQVERIRA
jgi:hypothetical protein